MHGKMIDGLGLGSGSDKSMRLKLSNRIRTVLLISASALALSACADVPPQYRVDLGAEPQYEDKTVRFRTTYYFRVFDLCEGVEEQEDSAQNAGGTNDFQLNDPVFYRNGRDKPLRLRTT